MLTLSINSALIFKLCLKDPWITSLFLRQRVHDTSQTLPFCCIIGDVLILYITYFVLLILKQFNLNIDYLIGINNEDQKNHLPILQVHIITTANCISMKMTYSSLSFSQITGIST